MHVPTHSPPPWGKGKMQLKARRRLLGGLRVAMAHNLRVLVARHPWARVSTRPCRNSTFQNGSPFSYKRAWRRSQNRVDRPMVVAKLAILPSPHTVWHHACNFCLRLFVGVAHCMMPCCMRRGVLSLGCSAKPSDRVQEGAQSNMTSQTSFDTTLCTPTGIHCIGCRDMLNLDT